MIITECFSCTQVARKPVEHRLPNDAVRVVLRRAQEGYLNTIKGNTVCLYTLYGEQDQGDS